MRGAEQPGYASVRSTASTDKGLISWLMQGDPAIRWQTMRDLLDLPEVDWQAERQLTLQAGWVKRYLDLQAEDGSWCSSGCWGQTATRNFYATWRSWTAAMWA